jgi:hypothetical protein
MNRLLNNGADSIAANPGKSDQESDFAVYRIDTPRQSKPVIFLEKGWQSG